MEDSSTRPILIQAFSENHILDPKELDFILEYVLSAMIGIMRNRFMQSKALTAGELIALMSDLMENGVMKGLIPSGVFD